MYVFYTYTYMYVHIERAQRYCVFSSRSQWILQYSKFHELFGFPVHVTVVFTWYNSLSSVQQKIFGAVSVFIILYSNWEITTWIPGSLKPAFYSQLKWNFFLVSSGIFKRTAIYQGLTSVPSNASVHTYWVTQVHTQEVKLLVWIQCFPL